jgi:hypothetical protein
MNPNLYPFFQAVNAKKQSSAILPLMPKSKETARSTAALTTTKLPFQGKRVLSLLWITYDKENVGYKEL